jgi:hypothetical protein
MLCNVYIREQNQHLKALGINSESPLFFVNLNSQQIEQLKTIAEPGEFEIYLINEDPYMRDLSNKWVNRGNVAPEVKVVERVVELPPRVIEKTIEVPVETIVEVEVVKEVVKNVFINPNTGEVMSETDIANIKAKANPIEEDQWEGTSDEVVLEEVIYNEDSVSVNVFTGEPVVEVVEELVEETKEELVEETKEEVEPVDDFDEVPSEDEIIIDTKVSFEEWKKDPKNIKPKKKKAKQVKVEKDPEPELEFEEVKDIPAEPRVKPDPFANEVIQDEVVVELTEEEAELYKDVEVEAEE